MTRQLPDTVTNSLRDEIRQFLRGRPDITAADLGRYTTLSDHTVRSFMNGNCPGGREVAGELRRVLEQARAGEILPPGGRKAIVLSEEHSKRTRKVANRHGFYETKTVKRVAEVLDYCVENAAIGVITADFGVGKTEAVATWRRGPGRKVESLVFEFDEFSCSNKVDFIQSLARMLGIPVTMGSQHAGRVFRDVCDHLRDSPCLLIFDQCETVRARVFQIIRQIWDRSNEYGVGVVLLSAPVLLARLAKSGMADLGALTSRVGVWA
ncbi:hypothetical protein LCGC14_2386280, partial [marine sediment metagenome]